MELATFWLPIIGAGIFLVIAISAWFADYKITAIWFGFGGVACLLLLVALQIQESVIGGREHSQPTDAEVRQLRAVSVVDGDVVHIIGKAPTVSLDLKNTGQTEARGVTWQARFAVASPNADVPLDAINVPATPVLAPGGILSYKYTFETWNPQWDELLKAETLAVIAVGKINYQDIYGNQWSSEYRFISGGAFGRKSGITPGKFGIPLDPGTSRSQ